MFGPIKAVVFDLDGTLVNTMPWVIQGFLNLIEKYENKKVELPDLLKTFGPAPIDVIKIWMSPQNVDAAFQDWLRHDRSLDKDTMPAFEGVHQMLKALSSNYHLGLFTGRDRESATRILKLHDWWGTYFEEQNSVCGDDPFPHKPSGEALLHYAKKWQLATHDILMVGDHPYDARAAKSVGAKAAAALWDLPKGQGTQRSRFKEAWTRWDSEPCDLRLEAPESLFRWLGQ